MKLRVKGYGVNSIELIADDGTDLLPVLCLKSIKVDLTVGKPNRITLECLCDDVSIEDAEVHLKKHNEKYIGGNSWVKTAKEKRDKIKETTNRENRV